MQSHQRGRRGRWGNREVFNGGQAGGSSLVGSGARIDDGKDLACREGSRRQVRGCWVEEVRVRRVFSMSFMSDLSLRSNEGENPKVEDTHKVGEGDEPPATFPKVDLIWIQWLIAALERYGSCHVR